ncbi:Hypothetical_protein [Hexamita inflata]|uniref:Hypothetical_protein n=1 Tax=Hexamita inflata TaxID=28002 RepID=A0AA86N5Q8_9EUKA|nr:Hypothetical protein HINF_LOCUS905 [Hexamita inflata]
MDSRRLNLLYQCYNSLCDQNEFSCLTRTLFISHQYQVWLSFRLHNFRILNCSLLKVDSSLSIRSQFGYLVNYSGVVSYQYKLIKAMISDSLANSITSKYIHFDFNQTKKFDGRNNIVIQIASAIQSGTASLFDGPCKPIKLQVETVSECNIAKIFHRQSYEDGFKLNQKIQIVIQQLLRYLNNLFSPKWCLIYI